LTRPCYLVVAAFALALSFAPMQTAEAEEQPSAGPVPAQTATEGEKEELQELGVEATSPRTEPLRTEIETIITIPQRVVFQGQEKPLA